MNKVLEFLDMNYMRLAGSKESVLNESIHEECTKILEDSVFELSGTGLPNNLCFISNEDFSKIATAPDSMSAPSLKTAYKNAACIIRTRDISRYFHLTEKEISND